MKKRVFLVLLAAALGMSGTVVYSAEGDEITGVESDIRIVIDRHEYFGENPPVIIDGRTYLPIRDIAEAMGATVNYNEEANSAEIMSGENPVRIGDDWRETYYVGEDGERYTCFVDPSGEIKLKTNYKRGREDDYVEGSDEWFIEHMKNEAEFEPIGINYPENLQVFQDGLAIITKQTDDGEIKGYMDIYGNELLMGKYGEIYRFSEGLAPVSTQPKSSAPILGHEKGFINIMGEMVIPEKYVMVNRFSEGLCAVNESATKNGWYFINKKGERAFGDKTFFYANNFSEGFCVVQIEVDNGSSELGEIKYRYIDHSGNFASEQEWDRAGNFVDGTAIVEKDGVGMRIDKNFKVVEILEDYEPPEPIRLY